MNESAQSASPKARPILFSSPMIQALLGEKKSQTRRIMKPQPFKVEAGFPYLPPKSDATGCTFTPVACPYGKPGDLLYVKETWGSLDADHPRCPEGRKPRDGDKVVYRANPADDYQWRLGKPSQGGFVWRSSLFMPRWASRLTLELTEVRVERLCDISEADAIAEGIEPMPGVDYGFLNYTHTGAGTGYYTNREGKTEGAAHSSYISLWESINGELSDRTGPWVWVLSFRVHQKNVDELLKSEAA